MDVVSNIKKAALAGIAELIHHLPSASQTEEILKILVQLALLIAAIRQIRNGNKPKKK